MQLLPQNSDYTIEKCDNLKLAYYQMIVMPNEDPLRLYKTGLTLTLSFPSLNCHNSGNFSFLGKV